MSPQFFWCLIITIIVIIISIICTTFDKLTCYCCSKERETTQAAYPRVDNFTPPPNNMIYPAPTAQIPPTAPPAYNEVVKN